MAPLKEEVPLIDVTIREPPDEAPSAAPHSPHFRALDVQDESSYQGGTPDVSSAATDMNTNQGAEGRWLQRARDLCLNRLVQVAISLIVGLVLGVVFSHVIGSCPPDSPSCPNKWMRSDGKCYFVSRETNDWKSSLEFCRSEGGTLLGVDHEMQKDIKTLYDLTGDYWVSLKKDSGEWKEMDGSVWTGSIEFDDPRRSCCLLDSGKYVAQDCSARRRWICVTPLRGDP